MAENDKNIFDSRYKRTNSFLNNYKRLKNFLGIGKAVFIQKQSTPFRQDPSIYSESLSQYDPKKGLETEWWFATPFGLGISRGINVGEVRSFAQESFAQMVMNTIKKEIINTPWDIVNEDEEDEGDYKEEKETFKNFLDNINDFGESYNDIVRKMLPDLLELDAGAWVKYKNLAGELKGIYARDGATFTKQTSIDGTIYAWYQYSWRQPNGYPIHFEPDELVYFMMNPRAYKMYGFAPLQSILQVLQLMIHSTRYNKEFFENNAMFDYLMNFKGMSNERLEEIKESFQKEYKGKGHITGFANSKEGIDLIDPKVSNRDMEWLAGQKWYYHIICGAYGMSPAEMGFHEDVNRSTQEGQERVTVRSAIKPYLKILEDKMNREIRPDILGYERDEDGKLPKIPIRFKYMPQDHVAEKEERANWDKMLQSNVISINDYRKNFGMEAVDSEYANNQFKDKEESKEMRDTMMTNGQQEFGKPGEKPNNPKKPNNDKKPPKNEKPKPDKKNLKKSEREVEFKPLEIVKEATDYEDFLSKWFKAFEKQVIKSIESDILNKDMGEKKFNKSFGDFLQRLFSIITTISFKRQVTKFIKIPMKEGLRSAEDELGLDIGISDTFNRRADFFADQQLNGYTLPDGKKWHGIKGVTAKLQTNIYSKVRDGVIEKKGSKEIAKDVKSIFKTAEESQAERIARTETNRFVNEGKIQAYRDSKLKGKKEWIAHLDNRTTDICRRLNGQKVELEEFFRDEKTGREFFNPPALPSCRSTTRFHPTLEGD